MKSTAIESITSLPTSISEANCQRSEVIQKRATCPQNRETTVLIGESEESGTHSFLPYGLCRDQWSQRALCPGLAPDWLQTKYVIVVSKTSLEPADLRFIKICQPTVAHCSESKPPKMFYKKFTYTTKYSNATIENYTTN